MEYLMETLRIQIKKLQEDAILPTQQTHGSAGYDLYSYCPTGLELPLQTPVFIPTGISLAIPHGYDLEIRPRSGLSTKHLLFLPNSPGTIDSDYRGEIMVCMINFGKQTFRIDHQMRIAQILIRKTIGIDWEIRNELESTKRGSGGFGSTGL
jgi:dUTP pyrophosphatase